MVKPLDFVLSEIVRVADMLGVHPTELSNRQIKTHGDVSWRDLQFYGGLAALKRDAANQAGEPPIRNTSATQGVRLRNSYVSGLERKAGSTRYLCDRLGSMVAEAFERTPVVISRKPKKLIEKKRKTKQGEKKLESLLQKCSKRAPKNGEYKKSLLR